MTDFDYLVVGGGTAGCIVAARLGEDPAVSVGLVEWGPSDEHEPRARLIRRWAAAAGSDHARAAAGPEDVIEGTGFFEIGYRPDTNTRSSSSICYLHPAQRMHANLHVLLQTQALRPLLDGGNRAVGVLIRA